MEVSLGVAGFSVVIVAGAVFGMWSAAELRRLRVRQERDHAYWLHLLKRVGCEIRLLGALQPAVVELGAELTRLDPSSHGRQVSDVCEIAWRRSEAEHELADAELEVALSAVGENAARSGTAELNERLGLLAERVERLDEELARATGSTAGEFGDVTAPVVLAGESWPGES